MRFLRHALCTLLFFVLLSGLAACSVARPSNTAETKEPIPVTVVRFEDYRPGGSVSEQDLIPFMNLLTTVLKQYNFSPTIIGSKASPPSKGVVITGQLTEMPKEFEEEGRVSFSCVIMIDGRAAKSKTYFQSLLPDNSTLRSNNDPKTRTVEAALRELMRDLKKLTTKSTT